MDDSVAALLCLPFLLPAVIVLLAIVVRRIGAARILLEKEIFRETSKSSCTS